MDIEKRYNIPPSLLEVASSNEHLFEDTQAEHLLEMSKIMSHETGLPVDIWIDEGNTFTKGGHGRIIKFQGDKNDPNTHNWVPLTVSTDPKISVTNAHYGLSEGEIAKIKEFVKINYSLFQIIGEIGILEFYRRMKKID
jgi:hypothetical protein